MTQNERATLRETARGWVREAATMQGKYDDDVVYGDGIEASWVLLWLMHDPRLGCIRDEAEVAKLPAEEQEACRAVWAEVDRIWNWIF